MQDVRLEPWAEDDLWLLRQTNAPEMTEHLGGPETEQQLLDRHRRYVDLPGTGRGRMFTVHLAGEERAAGSIGFWETVWRGEKVYETGWAVLPGFQGRGVAVAAARAVIAAVRAEERHRELHAFPSVGNPASNAICRRAGFTLLDECEFEYPKGSFMRCNDWCLDLTAPAAPAARA
ncbi:GNAT family N-acetyltransferase [Kitasatospora sp. NPDC057015]|uniref:GNAT family N-acetyltransferase n=1 Tax=Kitasatospora sp. NPDC057015 TaxID=3346001 RepID=UPI00363E8AA1